jgi:hypothetical protein
MILEDKSRRRQAERGARNDHSHSQKFRSRKVWNVNEALEQEAQEQEAQEQAEQAKPEIAPEEESELIRARERKTSEAAELLSNALGADGVALLLKAFSEEEQPHDLLSALRRRLQLAMAVKNGT